MNWIAFLIVLPFIVTAIGIAVFFIGQGTDQSNLEGIGESVLGAGIALMLVDFACCFYMAITTSI